MKNREIRLKNNPKNEEPGEARATKDKYRMRTVIDSSGGVQIVKNFVMERHAGINGSVIEREIGRRQGGKVGKTGSTGRRTTAQILRRRPLLNDHKDRCKHEESGE